MRYLAFFPLIALGVAACENFTAPIPGPQFAISDAVHSSGNAHFYFLTPMVRDPMVSGTFDSNVNTAVQICAWTGTTCGTVLATFTRSTGPSGQVISVDPAVGAYAVRWFTRDFNVDPGQIYRIRVLVGMQQLGFADVQVVLNNREAKNVNTGEFIPLVDGHILNIRFRIEQGALNASASTLLAGSSHTCGLTDSGALYCWGFNDYGALGNGTTTGSLAPVAVSGSLVFASLAAGGGGEYTCGLIASENAYCWGRNGMGALGIGTFDPFATIPTPVSGGLTFASLAVGQGGEEVHTCGLTTNGLAYCWGNNWYGQFGTGQYPVVAASPTPVSGGLTFTSLAVGVDHTCGLTADGVAYCWGALSASFGQLGTGTISSFAYAPTAVSGGLVFSALAAGPYRTCGLTQNGAAYCWGWNREGQLGNGTISNEGTPTPTAVSGGLTFAALTLGFSHTCGLTADGVAYCWGANQEGELGNGTNALATTPTAVSGGLRFVTLAAGGTNTCGLTASGAAYCWGGNDYGELGNGTTAWSTTPIPVSGGLTFRTP